MVGMVSAVMLSACHFAKFEASVSSMSLYSTSCRLISIARYIQYMYCRVCTGLGNLESHGIYEFHF